MKKIKNIFKKMSIQENETVNEENKQEQTENTEQVLDEKEMKTIELQAKIDELNDKYVRLYSEFDNFRKRTAKEKIDLMKTAGEDFFKTLLPVIEIGRAHV